MGWPTSLPTAASSLGSRLQCFFNPQSLAGQRPVKPLPFLAASRSNQLQPTNYSWACLEAVEAADVPPEGVDRVDDGAVIPGGRGQHGPPMGEGDVPHLICMILQHLQGTGTDTVAGPARLTGAGSAACQTAQWASADCEMDRGSPTVWLSSRGDPLQGQGCGRSSGWGPSCPTCVVTEGICSGPQL